MSVSNECGRNTIALSESTHAEELYDLHLTRQPNVDRLVEYMEGDRLERVSMAADSGCLTATFRRKKS
jgi:hypothetical protein